MESSTIPGQSESHGFKDCRASVPDADLKCRLTETLPARISLDLTRLVKKAVQSA
jgi:hypothetical protein